ncbi:MAG: leucine-rich repeat domain-containing protein [Clostridiales bacterium]|nr:leucine-rich repeat domain-containing protein [Clostridiales bacterium]
MKKTVKRIFAILLAVIMLGGAAPAAGLAGFMDWLSVTAASVSYSGTCGADGGNVTWTLNTESGVLLIDGNGAMVSTFLGIPWEEYRSSIKTIKIGDNVTSITQYAFNWCENLTEVVFGNSVTSIGQYAFFNCSGLTSIILPDSLKTIGEYAFSSCDNLSFVHIPSGITSIGKDAFINGMSLDYICSDASSFYIQKYAELYEIEYRVCEGHDESSSKVSGTCGENLTWTLNTDTGKLTISGIGAMGDYNYNSSPWYSYRSDIKYLTIGNGISTIGRYAFYGCTGLTSVTIPDSVTSIGASAFFGCTGLTDVTIGNGVTSIGGRAFSGCSGLTSVTIPDSVTEIGDQAFEGCTGLTSMTIPDSVTSIGWKAFMECRGLTSVTIGNGVTSIGGSAFYNCTGLTSVIIPDSVKSIGAWAFCDCTGLTSVTIGNNVTSIGECAFYNCTGLTSVYYNGSLEQWCKFEFDRSDSNPVTYAHKLYINNQLLTKMVIPDNVTNIGNYAFYNCTGLTSVTIPDSVTNIGNSAFYGCTGLTNVAIGNGVTSIGDWAFAECTGLTSITVSNGNKKYDSRNDCNAIIETESNTLICGCKNTIIPDSVTSIGNNAFYNCTGLTSVIIPDSVTGVGGWAFLNCTGLTNVTIPDSVTSIGSFAFADCTGLTSVNIGNSVTSMGTAFYGCTGLTSVTIGNGVTSIGFEAFADCTGLTSVTIPDSVTSIGGSAFSGCTGLTSVTIGNGVTSIGFEAFADCTGLTSVTIPDSVTSIGGWAFSGCSGLTSVTIPDSVTSIGFGAFDGCTGLTDVYYVGSEEDRQKISISSYNDPLNNATWHYNFTPSHIHTYTAVVTQPTCMEKGYTTHTCACGDSYVDDYVNSLGHDFGDWTETTPATCTEKGEETRYCSRCDATETQEIAALGHDFGEWKVTTPATCTEKGEETRYCSRCDATETQEIAATGHHYTAVVTKPTCTEKGYTTYTCACGDSYVDNYENTLGHDYVGAVTKEATCKEEGVMSYTCSRCPDSYTEPIAKKPHTEKTVRIEPTCMAAGAEYKICAVCGESIGEAVTLSKLAHDFGEWVTVKEPTAYEEGLQERYCKYHCGTKETQVLPKIPTTTVTNEETDISLTYPENAYDGEVELKIQQVFDGAAFNLVDVNSDKNVVFDITTVKDGVTIQPSGKVTIRIPLPAGFDPAKTFVYHVNTETGKLEKMPAQYRDGYMVFETDHFSYYALAMEKSAKPTVNIRNFVANKTVDYKTTITFTSEVKNAVSGATVHWFIDGKDVGTGDTYTVTKAKKSYTVQAKYIKDGKVIAESGVESVNVKTGFFAKLAAFFKSIFGALPKVVQGYLGADVIEKFIP